ncbi:MAG TPA: chemotaxis protein CheB [Gemmatimonadaceae bacterium]|jgi:two-component system chemotaxis response regulator CheB|nr:chemotaxis protein CheB [Gemmatimonadaceae bacterium]
MTQRDIVVIGASAGGVEGLSALVAGLPADLNASLFVVVHIPSSGTSVLPQILTRRGKLPAIHPDDGEAFERGQIYVAPPGRHLILEKRRMRLVIGPTEHGVRPAVDPLFRSAGLNFRERVVGILLSGNLDDGTAGLEVIQAVGGVTIVQDPAEALYDGMIKSAIDAGCAQKILSISEIPSAIVELVGTGVAQGRPAMADENEEVQDQKELAIDKLNFRQLHGDDQPGVVSAFTCPDCHGTLWELTETDTLRFRCRVGHAYAIESLLAGQAEGVESAFWIALRALEERAALLRRLIDRARKTASKARVARYTEEEQIVAKRAKTLRDVILNGILTNDNQDSAHV